MWRSGVYVTVGCPSSVCPSVPPISSRILLLRVCCCAPGWQGYIDRLLMVVWYGRRRAARRRAANASSATLTADVGSSTQTCFIRCGKWQRVWQLFQSLWRLANVWMKTYSNPCSKTTQHFKMQFRLKR